MIKINFRTLITILTILTLIIFLSSLSNLKLSTIIPESIEKNFIVLAIGIDKGEEGGYELTAISSRSGGESSGQSSSSGCVNIVCGKGETISEILKDLNNNLNNKAFFGHMKSILISDEVAKENILDVLDYFIRNYEVRHDFVVHIVKDEKAKEAIKYEEESKGFVSLSLENLIKESAIFESSYNLHTVEVASILDNKYNDLYLPTVILKEEIDAETKGTGSSKEQGGSSGGSSSDESKSGSGDSSEEEKMKKMELDGFAIFDSNNIVGYLDVKQAKSFNLVSNNIREGITTIKDNNDNDVNLDIKTVESKFNIEKKDDTFKVTIEIEILTNILEVNGQNKIVKEEELLKLEEKLKDIFKKDIEEFISYIKEKNSDILDLSSHINYKYPIEWEEIKNNWEEIYKELEIEVDVDAYIIRSYHINDPIGSTKEEE